MAALDIPKRKKMTAESLYEKATSAGDKLGRVASLGGQMLLGEDTGDGMAKDLAYGAVPGGSLYQRAMTGTKPGVLDYLDVIPGVGGLAGLVKAASFGIIPAELVKLLARRTRSNDLEKRLASLPTPVRESWLASFGDLHSKSLAKDRKEINPTASADLEKKNQHTLFTKRPTIEMDEPSADHSGLYVPFDESVRYAGYRKPKVIVSDYGEGADNSATLIHEGTHLMDELMGTTDMYEYSRKLPYRSKSFHPFASQISGYKWVPYIIGEASPKTNKYYKKPKNIHPLYTGVDFEEAREIADYQDITGSFSPLEYFYAKAHQIPSEVDSKPYYWLADDPHGLAHYKPYEDSDYIRDNSAATEGLAQFVESTYDVPVLNKTKAMERLAEIAEKDVRRKPDYSIDFEPTLKDLEDSIILSGM